MKLSELADKLGCDLEGDGDIEIRRAASIGEAGPGDITFLTNPRYSDRITETKAAAVIMGHGMGDAPIPVLRSKNPYLAFAKAIEFFYSPPRPPDGVHPTAIVAPSAKLGKSVRIGPYAVIGENVSIGDNTTIYPHVVIYDGAKIGERVTIHAHTVIRENLTIKPRVIIQNGAVIGADGFGFAKKEDGSYYKMVQSGTVVIEEDVEVQSLSAVDRGTVGTTVLKKGVKVDNLVQVAHGSSVGENSLLCSQVGLAGSTTLGKNVILAGQVGCAGHLTLGDNVIATAKSGLPNSVPADTMVSGIPAYESRQWRRSSAAYKKLPELIKRVRAIEKKLGI